MAFFISDFLPDLPISGVITDGGLIGRGTFDDPLTLANPVNAAQIALIDSSIQAGNNISLLNNNLNFINITQAQTLADDAISTLVANTINPIIATNTAQSSDLATLLAWAHEPLTLGDNNNAALSLNNQQLTLILPGSIETALQPNDNVGSLTNDVNYQTEPQVDAAITTAIDNLIDSAPNTLSTLNDLAAAFLDNEEAIDTITTLTTAQNAIIDGLQDQVDVVVSDIDDIEIVNIAQGNAIVSIQDVNTTQSSSILALQNQNTAQDTDISNLQTVNANQDNAIAAIEAVNATQGNNITALQNQAHVAVSLGDNNDAALGLVGQELTLSLPSEINTAIQPGDNISQLNNNVGFITAAQAPIQSVNGQTGNVSLNLNSFGFFFERTDSVTSNNIANYLNTNVVIPANGIYEVQFYVLLRYGAVSRNYQVQGTVGGTPIHSDTLNKFIAVEPKDDGNDIRIPITFRRCVSFTTGSKPIVLRAVAENNDNIQIHYANVTVKRFS